MGGGYFSFNNNTKLVNVNVYKNETIEMNGYKGKGGGIYIDFRGLTMEDVTINNNAGTGVVIDNGSTDMKNVSIKGNSVAGIVINGGTSELENVNVERNIGSVILCWSFSRLSFKKGTVKENNGIGIFSFFYGEIDLMDIEVYNNGNTGIHLSESEITMENISIKDNEGYGLYDENASEINLNKVMISLIKSFFQNER